MPLISVIVPIYKCEPYLKKCLDSICQQTLGDLEIILVDDGSPDGCGKICDAYARRDPRITVIHKTNGGLSSARNAGLDICTGRYIGFVDGDDYIAANFYELLYQKLAASDASFVGGGMVKDIGGVVQRYVPAPDVIYTDKEKFIYAVFTNYTGEVSVCNKLYDHRLFQQNRFRVGKMHEDNFIFLDILRCCQKDIVFTYKAIYYHVIHRDSITTGTFIAHPFDAIEASQYNLSILRSSFPSLVTLGEYGLFCTYRTVLDRYIIFADGQEHQEIIQLLRQHIRSELSILRRNEYFTPKKIVLTLLVCFAWPVYVRLIKSFKKY